MVNPVRGGLGSGAVRFGPAARRAAQKRLVKVCGRMAEDPAASLPDRSGGWGELIGAYRLLNNPRVDPSDIQRAHWRWTHAQCAGHPLVLCVQDTSDIDFTGYAAKRGLGPIGRQKGQGFLQHSALAVLPDGRLLGVLHQRWQVRVPAPAGETRKQMRLRWRESLFWAEAVEAVGRPPAGTRFVTVTDRTGDDFATFDACDRMGHGFVIRAQHDRSVEGHRGYLWEHMARQPVLCRITVHVPARPAGKGRDGKKHKAQPAREASVEVRAATALQLDAPCRDPQFKAPRQVNVVYAREVDPPADAEPLDWMLLTSEPAGDVRQALQIIEYYRCRWVIEEYHKVQKTGCRLEDSQLRDVDALRRLAAAVGVISVRMLWLRDLAAASAAPQPIAPAGQPGDTGRTESPRAQAAEAPAALRELMPVQWIRVVAKLAGVTDPSALTPRQFWRCIAQRGGWLGRKHDGHPGWQTVWRGWHKVAALVEGSLLLADPADGE